MEQVPKNHGVNHTGMSVEIRNKQRSYTHKTMTINSWKASFRIVDNVAENNRNRVTYTE